MADRRTRRTRKTEAESLATVALAAGRRASELAERQAEQPKGKTAAEGRVTIHLDPELARALRLAAADRACPQSDVVTEALHLLFSRKAPPGYRPSPEADLSPSAALRRARELKREGKTHSAIAAELNREGYRTRRGQEWTSGNVQQRLRGKV